MVDKVNFVQLMLVANPIALFTSEGGCLQRMHLFLQVLWYCKSQLYSTIATSVCNLSNSVRYKLNLDLNYEHATYLIKISNNFIEQSQAFFSFISNRRLWVNSQKLAIDANMTQMLLWSSEYKFYHKIETKVTKVIIIICCKMYWHTQGSIQSKALPLTKASHLGI